MYAEVARLPGITRLYDREHDPVWRHGISGGAARDLLAFWRTVDPDSGALRHDFTDPEWDTRFLGDLYQGLSEEAKKRYALLQTPEFVEEFILDRTLTPALDEFGPAGLRLIDPACGSGNFLYYQRLGDFFETYLHSRLSDFGLTETQLRAWSPPESRRTGRIRRRSR